MELSQVPSLLILTLDASPLLASRWTHTRNHRLSNPHGFRKHFICPIAKLNSLFRTRHFRQQHWHLGGRSLAMMIERDQDNAAENRQFFCLVEGVARPNRKAVTAVIN
jgi:hypothetical protein